MSEVHKRLETIDKTLPTFNLEFTGKEEDRPLINAVMSHLRIPSNTQIKIKYDRESSTSTSVLYSIEYNDTQLILKFLDQPMLHENIIKVRSYIQGQDEFKALKNTIVLPILTGKFNNIYYEVQPKAPGLSIDKILIQRA